MSYQIKVAVRWKTEAQSARYLSLVASSPLIEPRAVTDVLRTERGDQDFLEDFHPVHLLLHRLSREVEGAVRCSQSERVTRVFDLHRNSVAQLVTFLRVTNEYLALGECILSTKRA